MFVEEKGEKPVEEKEIVEEEEEEEEEEEVMEEEGVIGSEEDVDDMEEEEDLEGDGTFVPKHRVLTEEEIGERNRKYARMMVEALQKVKPLEEHSWMETLLVKPRGPTVVEDVGDKTERELVFVKQALEAAIDGCKMFHELDKPYRRPDDYYAEMIKSDEHMARIAQKLGEEKRRTEALEVARRQREMKKFGKQVQKEKEKEREERKEKAISAVKNWRKKHSQGDEFPIELAEDDDDGKKPPMKRSKVEDQERFGKGKKGREAARLHRTLGRSQAATMGEDRAQKKKLASAQKRFGKKSKSHQRKRK